MKKISILSIVILVVFGSFFGCKPKDDKAPKIYFSSEVETSQDWVLQEYYELPSATASDNVDGDVTDKITLSNDLVFYELRDNDTIPGQTVYSLENKIKNGTKGFVGKTGKYAIVYSATDEAGNSGSKTLTVNVLNSLNDWSLNASGVKINYMIKRKFISGDQLKIGGVYTTVQEDHYTWEDGYSNVGGKPVTTTLSPDKKYNYRLKISKIGNIGSLAMYVDFNRYSRVVDFIDYEIGVIQEMSKVNGTYVKTDFVYVVNQEDGVNEYNPELKSFTVTYQIERWKEDPNGQVFVDKDGAPKYDSRTWSSDRKCIYQETFVPE